jgi:hypothetical protein
MTDRCDCNHGLYLIRKNFNCSIVFAFVEFSTLLLLLSLLYRRKNNSSLKIKIHKSTFINYFHLTCIQLLFTNPTKPNQTKPNQTKPNQTKPNQTKPNTVSEMWKRPLKLSPIHTQHAIHSDRTILSRKYNVNQS